MEYKISKESVDKIFPKKDIDILGYESPITVIMGQMRMEQENNIYKMIQDYGVDVDKEELIKALQYDRNQYEKGYINGYNAKASDVARETIEEVYELVRHIFDDAKMRADNETNVMLKTEFRGEQIGAGLVEYALAELKKKYTQEK